MCPKGSINLLLSVKCVDICSAKAVRQKSNEKDKNLEYVLVSASQLTGDQCAQIKIAKRL